MSEERVFCRSCKEDMKSCGYRLYNASYDSEDVGLKQLCEKCNRYGYLYEVKPPKASTMTSS